MASLRNSRLNENKLINIFKTLDYNITNNLKYGGFETRPVKSNGLWCLFLLPTVLVLNSYMYNVSEVYCIVAIISIGLLLYSILFIIFLYVSCYILQNNVLGGCEAGAMLSGIFIYYGSNLGLISTFLLSFTTLCSYSFVLKYALRNLPKTFTIGEAMVTAQSIVLLGSCAFLRVNLYSDYDDEDDKLIYIVDAAIFVTVLLIVTTLHNLEEHNRDWKSLLEIFALGGSIFILLLFTLWGNLGLSLLFFLFGNVQRIKLLAVWSFLVLISVGLLVLHTSMNYKADTVTRKAFHILAALVFLSGILLDLKLMKLASGVGLGLIVIVEAVRKSKIAPFSTALQAAFEVYSDEKDCGQLAMTPLYMYGGLALPLALAEGRLERLSGVLAVGVGDTAASWAGTTYGRHKWPAGSRTFEGTAAFILTQILAVCVLEAYELLDSRNAVLRTFVAATIAALVEAKTEQVDNLILPLITLIVFQTTAFLK